MRTRRREREQGEVDIQNKEGGVSMENKENGGSLQEIRGMNKESSVT